MGLLGRQALELVGDSGKPRITCRRDRHFPAGLVELLLTKRLVEWSNSKRKSTGAEPFSLENLTPVFSWFWFLFFWVGVGEEGREGSHSVVQASLNQTV